jgi:hypothetical protein
VDVVDVDDDDDDVLLELVLLVLEVVADVPIMGRNIAFVQVPLDTTFIVVAASGTDTAKYPAINAVLEIPEAKGAAYPSASENRSKGPVSDPAKVNVINTVCAIIMELLLLLLMLLCNQSIQRQQYNLLSRDSM